MQNNKNKQNLEELGKQMSQDADLLLKKSEDLLQEAESLLKEVENINQEKIIKTDYFPKKKF